MYNVAEKPNLIEINIARAGAATEAAPFTAQAQGTRLLRIA
jgi:hypothetical protein